MKSIINFLIVIVIVTSAGGCLNREHSSSKNAGYNVLFITIDDLRPQLGCYGDETVKTPNIDQLASRGVLFERAYCQQALCGPSRASFLTGQRPGKIGVRDLHVHFRDVKPGIVTLPQLFKNNGYETMGLYKVFHLVGFDPDGFGNMNDTASWTVPLWLPSRSAWGPYGDSIFQADYAEHLEKGPIGYGNIPRSLAYEAPEVVDSMLSDGEAAQQAIRYIKKYKDQRFFIAVGFYKPHLPFVAPKKYWDLYSSDDITLPDNQYPPKGAPAYAVASNRELRSYVNIPDEGEFDESLKKNLLHGYMASISYIDQQVGLLLDELENQDLSDNTIVVVMGDHGYHIGEHSMWCKKHTNFEMAVRAPLIIYVPDKDRGYKTHSLTEFLDVYPTLAELCGLDYPEDLDGKSLLPVFENPDTTVHQVAFSSYPRGPGLGITMRTDRYRLTEWRDKKGTPVSYELYDHQLDPNENVNKASDPDYETVTSDLIKKLNNNYPNN